MIVNSVRTEFEHTCSHDAADDLVGQNTSGCREIPAAGITRALAEGLS
jgi:hypothetical protein